MANTTADIVIVFDRFGELAGQLRQRGGQVVRKTAFDVQAAYQQNCRVDTGAQKNSAYVVTASTSTYAEAVNATLQVNPDAELLPEVPHPDVYNAYMAIGVAYGAINEFGGATGPDGTQARGGDGALTKAAEAHRGPFLRAMNRLIEFQG